MAEEEIRVHRGGLAWRRESGVCVCGARAGCVYEGSSSPDMKRNSFIIANLQNINIRASTQSVNLSLCVFGSSTLWIVVRDVGACACKCA